jgi:hypothetical protein
MEIQITVDYRVEPDDFDNLGKVYPLGTYLQSQQSRWFRLKIDGDHGQIELTWFRVWD